MKKLTFEALIYNILNLNTADKKSFNIISRAYIISTFVCLTFCFISFFSYCPGHLNSHVMFLPPAWPSEFDLFLFLIIHLKKSTKRASTSLFE